MPIKQAIAGHFSELYKIVMFWNKCKSEYKAFSKQGATQSMNDLRETLDYFNAEIRKNFKLFVAYENFPVCVAVEDEGYYYVTKHEDTILFRETTGEGTYCWEWKWDNTFDELSIRDIDEIPVELSAFGEMLDELLYLLDTNVYLLKLSKNPTYSFYARCDMDLSASRINRILRDIPAEASNRRVRAGEYLDYKGLTLRYNANMQMWEIAKRKKGVV